MISSFGEMATLNYFMSSSPLELCGTALINRGISAASPPRSPGCRSVGAEAVCLFLGETRPKSEFLGRGKPDPGLLPVTGCEFYPRLFFTSCYFS